MPTKRYLSQTTYDAALERIDKVFATYPRENIYVAFSAGKDSTVLLNMALDAARRHGKLPLTVMTLDMEAMYRGTHDLLEEMMLRPEVDPIWICLPFGYRNAVSSYQPNWICWDPYCKSLWVRDMPLHPCVINEANNPFGPYGFRRGLRPSSFWLKFAQWFYDTRCDKAHPAIGLLGLRTDESLNRFRAVKSARKLMLDGQVWTTRADKHEERPIFNAYPIYDMSVVDVWKAIGENGWSYNRVYDGMRKAGITLHDMRICQPYGDDQRKGLDLFHLIEPETWDKVVMRVSGANMGSIYKGDPLLGNRQIKKPAHLNWKQYYEYLLNSCPPELREHYDRMVQVTIGNWIKKGRIKSEADIDPNFYSTQPGAISYARPCKMILRNDFRGGILKFSGRKGDVSRFEQVWRKYQEL